MTTKFLLRALAGCSRVGQRFRRPPGERGSMVAALLIAMAVLLGSLAISNRSNLAELASAYKSQNR